MKITKLKDLEAKATVILCRRGARCAECGAKGVKRCAYALRGSKAG